ncbi:hypothetical protein ACFLWW_00740 [Chloroflexota bacterium]
MTEFYNQSPISQPAPAENDAAIKHLKQAITSGKHWYLALLEAIGLWETSEEIHNEQTYNYLIAGEALDWLLLAERLCETVDCLIPDDEKTALLFHGEPPLNLPPEKFKELIGCTRHHQYLNHFYGITVEEALTLAVQEEVQKENLASGYFKGQDSTNEAYRRIYGTTKALLLKRFRQDKGYHQSRSTSLAELKEFTYWLFRYRLKQCDKAKVASDTKKALDWLNSNGFSRWLEKHDVNMGYIDISPSTPQPLNI